ncbi:class I SAM-dependent methyltransferase [Methanosphaerula palustris]|uniref:Methyltransferase n=1 Tax=Methanosphaerula palustris (strain ATCC BAA-1556 / DSM 19958 / E1-9c) TaxID=521011 RepID=B8GH46_METPE|nr:class I SAM-dependent methyltransferase [Methanosphaerula palustris]ACL16451.1 methyltransferase [Methanosphaerula palustris E1-9c]
MKKNQSSASAMGVAAFRAIEATRPEAERICYDPYARAFVPGIVYFFMKHLFVDTGLYERMARGSMAFIILRERYFDDFLRACLSEGLDQVVILGVGFDTRAYRIPGIGKTRVFEIDHPATQEVKLKKLNKIIDPLPGHVTFVPVDFNTQNLGERLQSSGYNEKGRTLFIWQGVTYFLTAEAVDHTLGFIANHSGPGSAVIFDYFYKEVLHDPNRKEGKNLRRAAKMTGEEYLFGIDRSQVGAFLNQRGFCDVRNVTLEDLRRRYFTGPNAGRVVPDGIAIVSARVNKDGDTSCAL